MAWGRRWLRATGKTLACLLGGALVFHLGWPGHYRFAPAEPFRGPHWYDPYADFDFAAPLKANFHSHSRLLPGITWGTHTPAEVRAHYRALGYDVYPLTNYQSLSAPGPGEEIPISAYEHGYGFFFAQHYTRLGTDRVRWLDYPLFQHRFAKQHLIEHLGAGTELLILNHPQHKGAFTLEDMRRLSGFGGIEVRSKFARGEAHWDAALSAGRPVWGFCSDDQHDLVGRSPAGIGWVWVSAEARTPAAVLEALRRGAHYGVFSRRHGAPNRVVRADFEAGLWTVRLAEPAERLRFVGQDGRVLAETRDAAEARYAPTADDPYVRFEAHTHGTQLYLNPLFRYAGTDPLARPRAERSASVSLAMRALTLATLVAIPALIFRPGRRE